MTALDSRQVHDELLHPTRTDHQVLVAIAQLSEEQLAQLRHIRNAVDQPTESRSSCTVKTSTRGQDLEVKSYADGLLGTAVDDALDQYARGMRKLAELQANQWQSTIESLAGSQQP